MTSTPQEKPQNTSIWEPLQVVDFRRIWFSSLLSNMGAMVQIVAAAWLMAQISDSEQMVALVQSSNALPMMLFSLLFGALADNFDRRRLVLAAQSVMFLSATVLTVLTVTQTITPWSLLLLTFLIGTGFALHMPSWQASFSDIVSRSQISKVVTLSSMGFNITRSIGPAAGGVLVALSGPAAAFAFNAFSYLPVITSVTLWKKRPDKKTLPREGLWPAITTGLRYLSLSSKQLTIMTRGFLFSVCAISVMSLLPLVARDVLGGTSVTFGLLMGAFGTGAVGGGLIGPRLRLRFTNEQIAKAMTVGFAAAAAGIALSPHTWLTILCLLPAGACWLLTLSMLNMSVQLLTPQWVMGRILSMYQAGNFGGMAIGGAIWGGVTVATSPQTAILISAACLFGNLLFGLLFPLPSSKDVDLSPANHLETLDLPSDIAPNSGPIAVSVEYLIAEENLAEFLDLMAARRRIRIKDGARHWALSRDLHQSERWVESYKVPTWAEYLRHQSRRTRQDSPNYLALRALHRSEDAPQVLRMIEHHRLPASGGIPQRGGGASDWGP